MVGSRGLAENGRTLRSTTLMLTRLLADGGLIVVVLPSAVVGIYWLVKKKPNLKVLAPYVLMAGITSLLVAKLVSLLPVQQARPFLEKGVEAGAAFINNPGFPSDHALVATVVVMAVYVLTPYRKTAYVLMGLTVLMCIARVLALVHTPLDIFGGIVAGLAGAAWYVKHKHDTIHAS